MRGHLRIGQWLPFRAVQLHCPPIGYVWAARATFEPIPIIGYDRFVDGDAETASTVILFSLAPMVFFFRSCVRLIMTQEPFGAAADDDGCPSRRPHMLGRPATTCLRRLVGGLQLG